METEAQRGEVTCSKPLVPLTLVSHQGSLPGTFFPPTLCSSDPSPQVLRETGGAAEGPGLWWVLADGGRAPKGKLVLIRGWAGAAG